MCRCAIGTRFCALRTDTRIVREQNSITGQPRPVTVWTSPLSTVFGVALMVCAASTATGSESEQDDGQGDDSAHARMVSQRLYNRLVI